MSATVIVTPSKAFQLLSSLLANSVGGPGKHARLDTHEINLTPGDVVLDFDFVIDGRAAALCHEGVHQMKLVIYSPHFSGTASLKSCELDFDNIQNLIYDACSAMSLPYGWPCRISMTIRHDRYEAQVSPIFANEVSNHAA